MKRYILILVVLTFGLILTGCGSKPTQSIDSPVVAAGTEVTPGASINTTSSESPARETINASYENALSTRLLLALGTLKLAETTTPITADQAPQLLMLWQGLSNLTNSGTSAEAEVTALLAQIELTLSPEQVAAINAMKLTQVEMQAWAQANGVTAGSGAGLELGAGQGQGSGMSPEARATKQAENGMTGTTNNENGLSASITKALISYLENLK